MFWIAFKFDNMLILGSLLTYRSGEILLNLSPRAECGSPVRRRHCRTGRSPGAPLRTGWRPRGGQLPEAGRPWPGRYWSWRPLGKNSTSTWCGEWAAAAHISRYSTSQEISFRRTACGSGPRQPRHSRSS